MAAGGRRRRPRRRRTNVARTLRGSRPRGDDDVVKLPEGNAARESGPVDLIVAEYRGDRCRQAGHWWVAN